MGRVLAGTALTALGTNLWGLNYLLPGIGLVLMLLGFRLLRRENRWFRCCFLLTGMQLAYCAFQLILQATPYQAAYAASTVGLVLPYLNRISHLASHLTRHGAAFGKAAHLAGCSIRQGTPFGRVFHSAGYTIWQDTSLSKALQPAHTVRKDLPIRG